MSAGDLVDRALDRHTRHLDPRDRAWTQELVYGVLRLRGRLDHLLGLLVRDGLSSLDPLVLAVLRLGSYQLLEMGSVPVYAAISQSVELVRDAGGGRWAGLVNGVLHNLVRRREQLAFPDAHRAPMDHLATWGSHPRWLVERWVERWGVEDARALVEANNARPELYLRPAGLALDEAVQRLAGLGIPAERVALSPDSLRLPPPASARDALAAVPAVVQDPAAALVVRYAAVPAGATVLDLCAAPGGKAVGVGLDARLVAAADLSVGRLSRLRENVERLGLRGTVVPLVADGRHPPFRPADVVLLDAPCTGTGTLRRHPDGRWRIGPDDLRQLAALQEALLDAAAQVVRPGGLLVYATCSLEPEENEEQVAGFRHRHPGFSPEPPPDGVDATLLDGDGYLRVLPHRHGFDGSFAARLRRTS